ncbi:MAG: TonB-dependent receptor [Flammeovirgaceae bacterium]
MLQKIIPYLFIVLHASTWAQGLCNIELSGKVQDINTGEFLVGALVQCHTLKKGEVCDQKGHFHWKNLCKGQYQISIQILGYEKMDTTFYISKNEEISFQLKPSVQILGEVNIVASKPLETNTLPQNTLTELENTRGQTLGESLKGITGVNLLKTGTSISKPVIHGMHSQRILILNNGIRQEGQQWGSEHAPEIDPFVASKLTVVKGAAAVQYGADAIGGVILVEPAPLPFDGKKLMGEVNLIGASNGRTATASAILQGGNLFDINGLGWKMQGTFKQAGNYRTPHYYLMNTGAKEQNFSTALGLKRENYAIELFFSHFNNTIGIFRGAHIGNLSDLQNAIKSEKPLYVSGFTYDIQRPRQEVQHNFLKINCFYRWNDKVKISLITALQSNERAEFDVHKAYNDSIPLFNRPQMQLLLNTITSEVALEHQINPKISGKLGMSLLAQKNRYEGIVFIPNFRTYSGGLFLIERWQEAKWEWELGIRYDYRWMRVSRWDNNLIVRPEYIFHNFSTTLGSSFSPYSQLKLSANIGTAWRPPHVSELFSAGLHHGTASVEIGNAQLKTEKGIKGILSAQYNSANQFLNFELSAYYQYLWDYIYLKPIQPPTLTIRGAFPTFAYTQVEAVFKGIDAKIDLRLHPKLQLETKFSLVRAFNLTENEYLMLIPPDRYENTLKYSFGEKGKVSVNLVHIPKQWRVPAEKDYAPSPNAYTLLNLLAENSFKIHKNMLWIGIGVENVLNTSYRDYMNRFRYFADELGLNFTLKTKFEF